MLLSLFSFWGLSLISLFVFIKKTNAAINDCWVKNLPTISSAHNKTTGVLAGCCITILALLARFRDTTSNDLTSEITIGLFILAFFGFIGSSLLFALVAEHEEIFSYFLFSVASSIYYFAVVLSFSALSPLLKLMGCEGLKPLMYVVILGAIIGGFLSVSIPFHSLLQRKFLFLISGFFSAIAMAAIIFYLSRTFYVVDSVKFLKVSLVVGGLIIAISFFVSQLTFFINKEKLEKFKSFFLTFFVLVFFFITAYVVLIALLTLKA